MSFQPIKLEKNTGEAIDLADVVDKVLPTQLPITSNTSIISSINSKDDYFLFCMTASVSGPGNLPPYIDIPWESCQAGINPFVNCSVIGDSFTLDHGRISQGGEDIKTVNIPVECDKRVSVRGRLKSLQSGDGKIEFSPNLYTKLFVNDNPGDIGSVIDVNRVGVFTVRSHMYSLGTEVSALGEFSGDALFDIYYD